VYKRISMADKKPTAIDVFNGNLRLYENQYNALLAYHGMTAQQFMVTLVNAVKKTPKLLECDQRTLFGAIMVAAELGLTPNTHMQFAHIIPYYRSFKDQQGKWQKVLEAQFQPGYQGLIEIAYRHPSVSEIESGVIYENEEWSYNRGEREKPFYHKPMIPSKRGEKWIAVYALAWLKDNPRPKVSLLFYEDVLKIKKISQAANSESSPWNNSEKDPLNWMPRKTAIKQLFKELPKTKDTERIINIDNLAETGGTVRLTDEGNVETIETTYFEELNKLEKIEVKHDAVKDSVKSMMPSNAGTVDKTGQTNLI